ncbi:MAG TPA: tripartite tricarboxylate transporter substrate binding protein [Desulfosporosinus sp.]|nr:tripartite tricarboxylate transporter substrate binding protein [Desulfosporosinus sp.]
MLNFNRKRSISWLALISLLSLLVVVAGCGQANSTPVSSNETAANYPNKTVTIIVGHAPGGSTDVIARALQPYLQKELGGTVVADNVDGGGGNTALSKLYKSPPDGYNILLTPFPSSILGELVKDGDFKVKDFTYIHGVTGGDYNSIFVKYDSPYQDLKSLVEANKKGKLTLSGSGIGTNSHLTLNLLEKASGSKFEYVSYDSGTEAAVAVAGGHTISGIGNIVSLKQLADEKKIRILAVFGAQRHPNFPDIPTATELGYANTAMDVSVGIIAPPKVPADIVEKLASALDKAIDSPEFKKQAADLGSNIVSSGPEKFKQDALSQYDEVNSLKDDLKPQ